MTLIKQITAGRRRAGMTRKEYLDYHFQVHGSIADGVDNVNEKPVKYIQTHIFDSAFSLRKGGPPNANHAWAHRDDVVELYFRDDAHMQTIFGSDYVQTKVGPDGKNFNDFESSINLLATEKALNIGLESQSTSSGTGSNKERSCVAMLFLASNTGSADGSDMERQLSPVFVKSLEKHASHTVRGLRVNIGVQSDFPLRKYFGGANMPVYALVYKVELNDDESIPAFRAAQAEFYDKVADLMDIEQCFVVFGREGIVFDHATGLKFDPGRQPTV